MGESAENEDPRAMLAAVDTVARVFIEKGWTLAHRGVSLVSGAGMWSGQSGGQGVQTK